MARRLPVPRITDVRASRESRLRRRLRWYLTIMGTCIALILLAWIVVAQWSTPLAVVMSVIAAPLPPIAAIVANWGEDG